MQTIRFGKYIILVWCVVVAIVVTTLTFFFFFQLNFYWYACCGFFSLIKNSQAWEKPIINLDKLNQQLFVRLNVTNEGKKGILSFFFYNHFSFWELLGLSHYIFTVHFFLSSYIHMYNNVLFSFFMSSVCFVAQKVKAKFRSYAVELDSMAQSDKDVKEVVRTIEYVFDISSQFSFSLLHTLLIYFLFFLVCGADVKKEKSFVNQCIYYTMILFISKFKFMEFFWIDCILMLILILIFWWKINSSSYTIRVEMTEIGKHPLLAKSYIDVSDTIVVTIAIFLLTSSFQHSFLISMKSLRCLSCGFVLRFSFSHLCALLCLLTKYVVCVVVSSLGLFCFF